FLQEINRKKIGKDTPELQRIKTIVLPLLQKEKIIKAGVFGSYARGEQTKRSDIDILIQYRRNSRKSLLNVVQLERKVGEALGKKVDIITYDELSPYLRQRILHDEVSIL
ncbi:MAG TPA: nucleotidyltransferase domain-containing protein, partial [Candidatus Nanoarchaeia archaeon]|nr:nucleotidyltransferase domain-containing protein [Candidatus Nanoarchaeia archaeon]